jgi:hypothetical protein
LSKLYDALRKLEAERAPGVAARLDAVRLSQFLDSQDEVLRAGIDAAALAPRLAHAIATLLGLAGAAIAVVEHGRYRLLALHGVGGELLAADDGVLASDTGVARALETGSPIVVAPPEVGPVVRRIVLPFRGDPSGAVELLVADDAAFSPDDVAVGRVLSTVIGMALSATRARATGASRT